MPPSGRIGLKKYAGQIRVKVWQLDTRYKARFGREIYYSKLGAVNWV